VEKFDCWRLYGARTTSSGQKLGKLLPQLVRYQASFLNEILIFILIFSTPGLESSTYSRCLKRLVLGTCTSRSLVYMYALLCHDRCGR
jgi:hypothetical protein